MYTNESLLQRTNFNANAIVLMYGFALSVMLLTLAVVLPMYT